MRPKLPNVGEQVELFGVTFIVEYVEPVSDWFWQINGSLADDRDEGVFILIPTDYRTTDGKHHSQV